MDTVSFGQESMRKSWEQEGLILKKYHTKYSHDS